METWGCQMNEHDSEKMAGLLAAQGMVPASAEREADVILLNTCAIREKAAEKVFTRLGQLRRLKLELPELVIGVCGCVAQMEQERIFRRAPHVDFVMGPRHLGSLARLVRDARHKRRQVAVLDLRDRLAPEEPERALRSGRAKAYITVMEGCNKGCTFCVVPSTRGRESCRTPESILDEAAIVVEEGFPEIELLGQNVNAYRSGSWDFTRLLSAVSQVAGLHRLRFTTSHPLHFKNSIHELMRVRPALCPHVHLPIQSGSNRVLQAMRRGHTREEYIARIDRARRSVPGLAFSTDVIVGFPGETEGDFQQTLEIIRVVRFHQMYAFVYSPRPETPAASLEDGVPRDEKSERLQRLLAVQERIQREIGEGYVGRTEEVLVQGPSVRNPKMLTGRTVTNKIVNFAGAPALTGKLVDVRIVGATANSLRGEMERPVNSLTSTRADDITSPRLLAPGGDRS
jgi:tRNA-2-methylthio-N6-dimethylallyladenosine synthase